MMKKQGFTLIEMIVAVAVFSMVALISAGSLLAIVDAQAKATALRSAQDGINFSLETMAKEARTGRSFHCGASISDFSPTPQDCLSGGPSFTFINNAGQTVTYRANSGRLEKILNADTLHPLVLTSPEVNITRLTFYVRGAPAHDWIQPRATLILNGTAGIKVQLKSQLNIQTTITQRLIDS